MNNKSFINLTTIFLMVLLLFQTASATVLTFEVEEDNAYVGSGEPVKYLYGYRVDDANRYTGNYLVGNGWTPNIEITYSPYDTSRLITFEGGGVLDLNIVVVNGDFETGEPYVPGGMPPWAWGYNNSGANFFREMRYGSTAPPWPMTYPTDSPYACAGFYKGGWAYQNLDHTIMPNTTYTVRIDIKGLQGADDPCIGPTGWCGYQIYEGNEPPYTEIVDSNGFAEADTNTVWRELNSSFPTPGIGGGGGVGMPMTIRLIQQDGFTNGHWHYAMFDNVRITYPVDFSDWGKVAVLPYPLGANWDILFAPDRGYAVDLNSFELDPAGNGGGNQSGTWTVYADDENGAVIDSGSWTNLTANSVETVDMSSVGGSYNGPVLLRLVITSGNYHLMAIDNVNYDQVTLDCDKGFEEAWDLEPDCSIDFLDVAKMAAKWMQGL